MSIQNDFKRIIRGGFTSFSRNTLISITSILIMTVTLCTIGATLFLNAVLSFSLTQIEERVDINIYFYPNAPLERITAFQQNLETLPEVSSVEFISQEAAIVAFRERHADDFLTLQALDELDQNPLGAALNVRAQDSSQYETIANFIETDTELTSGSTAIVEKVNFYQNEAIIERLNSIIDTTRQLGLALTLFFIIVSILITFNTIRLTIYVSREEIAVMRLVGADNKYIRGPFMVEGVIYGLIATLTTLILLFPITLWVSKHTTVFFGGLNLFDYYLGNFIQILIILLVAGVLIGMIASFIAIRKYLRK